MRRSVTPISHDHIVELLYKWNQCANGRWKHFAPKIVCPEKFPAHFGWDPGRAFRCIHLAFEFLQGFNTGWQTGSVLLTSSVDMEIGPSPRRLIISTIGLLSSRERKAVIQVSRIERMVIGYMEVRAIERMVIGYMKVRVIFDRYVEGSLREKTRKKKLTCVADATAGHVVHDGMSITTISLKKLL